MTQPVRHKERLSSTSDSILHIALHQPQLFQTIGNDPCSLIVHLPIKQVRFSQLECAAVRSQNNIINSFLASCKFTIDRNGTGEIAAIVHIGFSTGIDQQQTP